MTKSFAKVIPITGVIRAEVFVHDESGKKHRLARTLTSDHELSVDELADLLDEGVYTVESYEKDGVLASNPNIPTWKRISIRTIKIETKGPTA